MTQRKNNLVVYMVRDYIEKCESAGVERKTQMDALAETFGTSFYDIRDIIEHRGVYEFLVSAPDWKITGRRL